MTGIRLGRPFDDRPTTPRSGGDSRRLAGARRAHHGRPEGAPIGSAGRPTDGRTGTPFLPWLICPSQEKHVGTLPTMFFLVGIISAMPLHGVGQCGGILGGISRGVYPTTHPPPRGGAPRQNPTQHTPLGWGVGGVFTPLYTPYIPPICPVGAPCGRCPSVGGSPCRPDGGSLRSPMVRPSGAR